MHNRQLCPRRAETGQPIGPAQKQLDDWYKRDGVRHRSYCGSMHPDDFMDIARGQQPGELGPTDKSYKVYVDGSAHAKFYFQHLSDEQMSEFVNLYNARPRRDDNSDDLSYTVEEGDGMQVGYPGYFYALPFFMGRQHA